MIMIRSAKQFQILELFSMDKNVQYHIPKYQREFKWRLETSIKLFSDLLDNDEEYFLGTILCINRASDTLAEPMPLELIDGQQRLASISLLYAAIYDKFLKGDMEDIPERESSSYEDFITEKNNLKNKLIQKEIKNQLKLELSTQENNQDDYKYIMKELGLYEDSSFSRPLNLGKRRLYKTYKNFKEKLIDSEFNYETILKFLSKINRALIVKIEVENSADAFMLFESLNNRGEPLSPMDLVKNRLLGKLETESRGTLTDSFRKWKVIIKNLLDHSTQERFLRHFYNAFKYKKTIGIIALSKVTRSKLIDVYEKLINKNANFLLEELITKSKIYNYFVEPQEDGDFLKFYQLFLDLQHIGSTPSYMFLLYLFSEHSEKHELLKNTLEFLVKYFVRRNLTDEPATRKLDTIFINLVEECERNRETLNISIVKDFLTDHSKIAPISEFKKKLEGDIYESSRDATRFILTKLEETTFTIETWKDLWIKDKNKYVWTIEHIFPKGKNLHEDWINIIASGDKVKAEELQKQFTHKLGNLTITAYNPNLSNSPFLKKRDKEDKNGNPIGFKNKLNLNRDLATKDSWTIKDIENRTEILIQNVLDLFSIDGESG